VLLGATAAAERPLQSARAPAIAPAAGAHRTSKAEEAPPAILPLSEVRAGMTGYGLTVFSGTRPERFPVRVIGVLHNFLPKQDIILIRCDDERLLHTGVTAGMSGSPIYLNGKLAGALAYGWSFAKDPLAGVTPIENILAELRRPRRGREQTAMAMDLSTPPPLPQAGPGEGRLVPAAVPLSVAGLTPGALAGLAEALQPYNIIPLQAGGAARPGEKGPDRFEPGSAIAVQLIRGDISAAGTGTVTYVEGSKVAAFGHPMFNAGEVYLPIATAQVLTFMPSLAQSFKLASPIEEKGTLTQDRQACIVADTAERTEMVPVRVRVTAPGKGEQVFNTEVARHRFLTPILASTVATSAVQNAAQDVADAVIEVRSKVELRGYEPLTRTDFTYSPEGVSPRAVLASSGMRQLQELLFNPFRPARIDRVDLDIHVEYRADVAEIISLHLSSDELEPGTRPSLFVTLRPYNGRPQVRAIPFEVPRSLAGQTIKIEASAGNLAKPDVAPPESLDGLIANLRKGYPARSLVVTVVTPDEGVLLRGQLIPSLPASVIATLRPASSTRKVEPHKRLSRFVVDMGGVITGKQEISVRVRGDIN
jgi:hypothetical protein